MEQAPGPNKGTLPLIIDYLYQPVQNTGMRKSCLFFFLLAILIHPWTIAQPGTCSGSLGDPVVNISFGSGSSNPGPALGNLVPGASTNYNYAAYATGNPPAVIFDGDYSLVNAVPNNSAWFTGAADHTGDPGGYMAFFNAAPNPGEFYRQTVTGLCPSTTYEFAAWVANVLNPAVIPGAILPNITFRLLDGVTQTELAAFNTGNINMTSTFTWQRYSFLFTLPPGNASVTLVLANNNIGGTAQPGNDLAIDDISFSPCGPATLASFEAGNLVDYRTLTCGAFNLYGQVSGGLNNPAFQWQVSTDGGLQFTDLSGATGLVSPVDITTPGDYIFRLLSAESGNIQSPNCRYASNLIRLTVSGCSASSPPRIINHYAAVERVDPCNNSLTVDSTQPFSAGDTVVLMQMKGASIETTNGSGFGTITAYNNAGRYEMNTIDRIAGNTVYLRFALLNNYDDAKGALQLIRVPAFDHYRVTDTLTCLPWDGKKGGVLILNSRGKITLDGVIDVSEKGFRGGGTGAGFNCNNVNSWAVTLGTGGTKGEGITDYIPNQEAGGARLANGGGGAYSANTGGGGGGNAGAGGNGGNQTNTCAVQTFSYAGEGYLYTEPYRILMGGAGGGGQQDDGQPVAAGGNGGGIIILISDSLAGNNGQLLANGASVTTLVRDEGGAGGGAGGSILLYVNGISGSLSVSANGGDGSSNDNQIYPSRCHGPGGGGGGGWIGYKNSVPLPPLPVSLNGGIAGRILNSNSVCYNTTHGAQDGQPGFETVNNQLPLAIVPFTRNLDSVRIDTLKTGCKTYRFNGIAYPNNSPALSWHWDFGDGDSSTAINPVHTYREGGSYPVTVRVSDPSGCRDSFTVMAYPSGRRLDFIFEQDACSTTTLRLDARGGQAGNSYWSMGDGTVYTGSFSIAHTYADTGTYLIRYHSGTVCEDTVSKEFTLAPRAADIILVPDTTLCFGASLTLQSRVDTLLGWCWQPSRYLDNPAAAQPRATPPGATQYILLARHAGNTVVNNGAFNLGLTGMETDYAAGSNPLLPGQFLISNNSGNAGGGSLSCTDPLTAGENMLLAMPGPAGHMVRQQAVLQPHTPYQFSVRALPLVAGGSDTVMLLVNGIEMARDTLTGTNTCNWTRLHFNWNPGDQTSAQWAIRVSGNSPIALDDIRWQPLLLQTDTLRIAIDTPRVVASEDTSVCAQQAVRLFSTGAVSYSWTPAGSLSSATIADPMARPDSTTRYVVTGINAAGCSASDTVTLTLLPAPQISLTPDTAICRNSSLRLQASGGIRYAWQPASAFSNPGLPDPVIAPAQSATYRVTVTATNSCSATDSVTVSILPAPVFSISSNQTACLNSAVQLNAAGGNQYTWSPAAPLNRNDIANPVARCDSSTVFSVFIRDSRCNDTATLQTAITVLPAPLITAGKSNDLDCSTGSTQLQAGGALRYLWQPATGLNDPNLSAPVASPRSTTTYTVTGTNAEGCTGEATVEVRVDQGNRPTFLMPNAFSPNGDGLNDCYGIRYFGQVLEFQLLIYNRLGELVFFTENPNACWNGLYKGKPALAGSYVYYLKARAVCGRTEQKGNLMLIR